MSNFLNLTESSFHLQIYRQFRADVYCENGKIKQIGLNLETPKNVEILDATDKYVENDKINHFRCFNL